MSAAGSPAKQATASEATAGTPWTAIPDRLRARGLRWTPQRRVLVEVLSRTNGHVTGAELIERCRELDPDTTPSTVYRTLDVLEELGVLSHSHGASGREEFHVLPASEHAHLQCETCGGSWEIEPGEAADLVRALETGRGFRVRVGHLSIVGECVTCSTARSAHLASVADPA